MAFLFFIFHKYVFFIVSLDGNNEISSTILCFLGSHEECLSVVFKDSNFPSINPEEGMKFISAKNIHLYQCLLFFDK